ncbi:MULTISPECIES: hypothetical protein [unclassified Streptomyces]|uniref:hypothetical protein n=1 Tax=unclassified Streptomyces TaxID=2593676 RepID=UPI002366DC73|nr:MULTISPECIES: hypothetical protein [unclassified Streptomyces]MDF3148618.1 hypothetical protein [Streptomyces sp. T21Q-yed]WDF43308.1 hypothetical protein PBV52_44235 [Streptomyces sp. T12]
MTCVRSSISYFLRAPDHGPPARSARMHQHIDFDHIRSLYWTCADGLGRVREK